MELYVHFPFCKSKCRYCDFVSFSVKDNYCFSAYLTALKLEIELASKQYHKLDTVYFGGGTPSLLSENDFSDLCGCVFNAFDLKVNAEVTVECNPESLTEKKLARYKASGVNRVSIGVQSLDEKNLSAVGRIHTAEQAIDALKTASKFFDNVCADLIVGLPFDNEAIIKDEIEKIAPYVKHFSVYMLQLEEGTPLFDAVSRGEISVPDDDRSVELFETASETLKNLGFNRYEISNFALSGFEGQHNLGYWTGEEYLGLGLNSSSYVFENNGENRIISDGKNPSVDCINGTLTKCKDYGYSNYENRVPVRYKNTADLNEYVEKMKNADDYPVFQLERREISPDEQREEKIMLGLRTSHGIEKSLLADKSDEIKGRFAEFFTENGDYIALNGKGMNIMNYILGELL